MFPRLRFAALCGAALLLFLGVRPTGAVAIFDSYSVPIARTAYYAGGLGAIDVDLDGRTDLLSNETGGFGWFRSLGGGSFAPWQPISTPEGPFEISIVDLDGDSRLDLVGGVEDSSIVLFYGLPGGGFEPPVHLPFSSYPWGRTIAVDLNGDPWLDLVVPLPDEALVAIRLASGPRSYAPAVTIPTLAGTNRGLVSDWNLDGLGDLVLFSSNSDSVTIHPGIGGGSFGPPQFLATPGVRSGLSGPFDAVPGDDLMLLGSSLFGSVLPSVGDGTFGAPIPMSGFRVAYGALADFNEDGRLDAVGGNYNTLPPFRYSVAVALGLGDGTFLPATTLTSYSASFFPTCGDFDDDGHVDIAIDNSFQKPITLFFGNGDGTFGTPLAWAARFPRDLKAGDLDGDLLPDAVVADSDSSGLYFFRGLGTGAFAPRLKIASLPGARGVRIGDVNHDAFPDLVAVGSGSLTVVPGGPAGAFGAAVSVAASVGAVDLAVGDLDGDGWLDAVVADGSSGPTISIFRGGAGGFVASGSVALAGTSFRIELGRFDADALLDLAVTNGSFVSVFRGNGAGGFVAPGFSVALPGTGRGLLFDDFDGDGRTEIAVAHDTGLPAGVAIFEENGSGGPGPLVEWTTSIDPASGSAANSPIAADFDGDGDRDLLVASSTLRFAGILLNQGDGTFAAPVGVGNHWPAAAGAVADFDGDGGPDVLLATTTWDGGANRRGALSILLNRVAAVADAPPPPAASPAHSLQLALAPNPATTASRLTFVAPQAAGVSIDVYSVSGRREASRALGTVAAGRRSEAIPGRERLRPGLYWARVSVGMTVESIRFAITR